MVYTCGVAGCTTGYKSNESDKKINYLDFPLMKILGRNGLQLCLEKNGWSVKISKCTQSISF